MEQLVPASAEVPQAAPVEVLQQPVGGQPPQMGGEPPVAPEAQIQTEPVASEFQFELPSGTKYRTVDDLVRGATEKDFVIERYKAQLAELNARSAQPQTPQVDPQAAATQAIAEIAREFENDFRQDPRFANASPEDIATEAYIQAKSAYRAEQRALQKFQQQAQVQQFEQFVATTPELNTTLAQEVYDRARASGHVFPNPQAHLDAVHAEMFRRGIPNTQAQPPQAHLGVQAAMQQTRPVFGGVAGSGAAPGASGSLTPTQQAQLEFAEKHYTGEALERIKQRTLNGTAQYGGMKR